MDRSNALLIAQDAARHVWNKIGQIKHAGCPLEAWTNDVFDSRDYLTKAIGVLADSCDRDEVQDLYHRLWDALAFLTCAVKKKRVYRAQVIRALDCLGPILPRRS